MVLMLPFCTVLQISSHKLHTVVSFSLHHSSRVPAQTEVPQLSISKPVLRTFPSSLQGMCNSVQIPYSQLPSFRLFYIYPQQVILSFNCRNNIDHFRWNFKRQVGCLNAPKSKDISCLSKNSDAFARYTFWISTSKMHPVRGKSPKTPIIFIGMSLFAILFEKVRHNIPYFRKSAIPF